MVTNRRANVIIVSTIINRYIFFGVAGKRFGGWRGAPLRHHTVYTHVYLFTFGQCNDLFFSYIFLSVSRLLSFVISDVWFCPAAAAVFIFFLFPLFFAHFVLWSSHSTIATRLDVV